MSWPLRLRPACVPPEKKPGTSRTPPARVTGTKVGGWMVAPPWDSRADAGGFEALRLGETERDVHVLDGLAGRSLDEVVNGRHEHDPLRAGVDLEADVAEVGTADVADLRQARIVDAHEGRGLVEVVVGGEELLLREPLGVRSVDGGEDAAVDRQQVRGEVHEEGGAG